MPVMRICTRCGRKIEGQWVIGPTCRNTAACERRAAATFRKFYDACTDREKALMRSGMSPEDIEYTRAKAGRVNVKAILADDRARAKLLDRAVAGVIAVGRDGTHVPEIEVIKHTHRRAREDRHGRVRDATITEWDVVRGGELFGSYPTRREALAARHAIYRKEHP